MRKIEESKKWMCLTCGFVSSKIAHVKRHIISKHLELKYTCQFCLIEYSSEEIRKNHIKNVHNNPLSVTTIRALAREAGLER